MPDVPLARLASIADALSIGRIDRHVFLCAGQATPRCSSREQSLKVWTHLKRRLKDEGLTSAPPSWRGASEALPPPSTESGAGTVLRTRVDCLRVCEQGPIGVVYPEGAWYRLLDESGIDRMVEEHLIGGRVVEDLLFALAPLPRSSRSSARGADAPETPPS